MTHTKTCKGASILEARIEMIFFQAGKPLGTNTGISADVCRLGGVDGSVCIYRERYAA